MKLRFLLMTIFMVTFSFGQGTESFANLNASGTTYVNGSYIGDTGNNWNYTQARSVNATFNINGQSVGFPDTGLGSINSNSGVGGVGTLNYSTRSYFTGGLASDRTIAVYVNSILVESFTLPAMNVVYSRSILVNVSGNVSIEFRSVGSRQIVLDDVSWNSSCTPPANPSGTITVTPSCGSSSLAYSLPSANTYWQTSATGTLTTFPTTSPYVVSSNGTYYVRNFNGTCWSTGTVSQTVTIVNPVIITTQPLNQAVIAGSTATFNVLATNVVSYQWQVSTNSGGSWSNIGTNTNSYTTPATTLAMNGYLYRVIITGTAPCPSVNSAIRTLTVTTGPCLSESFSSVTFPPAGWLQTAVSRSTTATDYNTGPAAATFGANNGELTTAMVSNPTELRFFLGRTTNTTDKTLTVEVSTTSQTSGFTTVATYDHSNVPSGSYNQYTVNLSSYTSSSSVWIRFVKTSSTTSPWRLDDINVYCGIPCTSAVISSITPNNGPVGTQVTINASSGNLSSATVTFNGITASVVSSSTSQLVVVVPNGATTASGNLVITDGQPCTVATTFTVNKKTGSCGNLSDLIMSEIYDNPSGSLGYIEVFNGTGAPIDLSTYYIRRYGDNADFVANNFTDFTFSPSVTSIANGAVIYGRISTDANIATPSFDYGNSSGINGNDILHLYNGSTLIDVYIVPNNTSGYTALRNTTTSGPNAISNPSDWTHTNTASIANLGSYSFVPSGATPSIVTNPVSVSSCSNSVTFSVAATPFGIGVLTYQWYYNNGTTSGWTLVNTTSFPSVSTSGFTTNTLNLSGGISNINGYQFYCLVIQDGICSVYSNAAQLKIDSTTWNGTSWSSGLPSLTTLAIINGNYNTSLNGSFECCSLTVNNGFTLNIQANDFVLIENNLTVNGTLNVLDDGSLVQNNNAGINTGNISYERVTTGNPLDYVFWSSPISNQTLGSSNYFFYWNTVIANTNGGFGNWINASGNTMNTGVGYILRDVFSKTFSAGIPHNGIINVPISRGNYTGTGYLGTNGITITNLNDNLNLIGNPYPSAVNTMTFLTVNTNIEGAVRIWTHGTSPSSSNPNPFYGSYQQNYSSNDYIIYNGTGTTSGQTGFSGNIAGGQGFFVIMNDGTATTQNVVFNNSMRNKTYGNNEFYRSSTLNNEDKSRIWLNFNSSNESSKTLIGYIGGATMDKDRLYDAVLLESSSSSIYSLIDSKKMVIQGRFPFNDSDKVPFGVKITQVGNNSIGIDAVDGVFESQNIYLEDLYLNIVHNLKTSPYYFTSSTGVFNDRFILKYRENILSNNTMNFDENQVSIIINDGIEINSKKNNISSINIYDVLGRKIASNDLVNLKNLKIKSLIKTKSPLIVKIVLDNDTIITKKVIY